MGVAGKHFPSHGHDAPNDASDATAQSTAPANPADERIRKESFFGHVLNRPEFAAISGTVLVFLVFALTAGSSGW